MAAEIKIDGGLYEWPTRDTWTMDEWQVIYDNTGLTMNDFILPDDEEEHADELERKLRNPGMLRALMQIAYQRKHPKVPAAKVRALIGVQNPNEAFSVLDEEEDGEDEVPPALTSEPGEASKSGSLENESSSALSSVKPANGSPTGSDTLVVPPTPIGTTRSAT